MSLSELLKRVRRESGKTQFEIAELMEISCRTYQRYESGKTEVNRPTLLRLFEILNIKTSETLLILYKNEIVKLPGVDKFQLSDGGRRPTRSKKPLRSVNRMTDLPSNLPINAESRRVALHGFWQWNYLNEEYYWSPEMFEIFEFNKNTFFSIEEVMGKINKADHFLILLGFERLFVDQLGFSLLLKRNHSKLGHVEINWSANLCCHNGSVILGEVVMYLNSMN